MKTSYRYLFLLLLCLTQALHAQNIPPQPEKPLEPLEPYEMLQAGASVTKRLIYHDAPVNTANYYRFSTFDPLVFHFDFSNFSYSRGYGDPLPQTTIYLSCNLQGSLLDAPQYLFSLIVDGETGQLIVPKQKPFKLPAGDYQFTFTGHFTDLPLHRAKGITPFTSVVSAPAYMFDLHITTEAVPVVPLYPDPEDEVLPSISAPDAGTLISLPASAGMNSVCTFASSDGSLDKGNFTVAYSDGLGRLVESARKGCAPQGRNLVALQEYDPWGRKGNTWLEAAKDTIAGAYISAAQCQRLASLTNNGDVRPYVETVYEASPLNRPIKQYGPGQDWYSKDKAVSFVYTANTAGAGELGCLKFTAVEKTDSEMTVTATGYYDAGSLQVLKTTDEDGNVRLEFTDRNGNTVLHRQTEIKGNSLVFYDTYYVYDGAGSLQTVLPPELSAKSGSSGSLAKAELDKYAYLYFYDDFRRVSGRKLPGAEWERFIYDDNDRLVFSQDGNLNKEGKWRFTLSDRFDRVCLEGVCEDYQFLMDRIVLGFNACCDYKGAEGDYYGYAVSGVKIVAPVFTKVAYYDNYRFLADGWMPDAVAKGSFDYVSSPGYGEKYVSAKERLTGTLTARMEVGVESSSAFLGSAFYYDERGRLIQSRSSNHLNGMDTEYVAYNFNGQPLKRLHEHSAPGKVTLSELYTYSYDETGLPLTVRHRLDNGMEVLLSDKEYDALGRPVQEKRNGNMNLLSGYTYNLRSWLTSINGMHFAQNLYYNTGNATARYNGNISSMTWKAGTESIIRGYRFTYDGLDRLTNAAYGETSSINANSDRFSESVSGYDKNSNIKGLQRYGQISASAYGLIDNLTYTLSGNQLNRVDDASTVSAYNTGFEFKDGARQADEYAYDANGNLTKDLNKGISDIQYNFLNLPGKVTFGDGSTITYTYAADGTKLRTVHKIGGATTTTDYCRNVIYENSIQKLLLTDAGYVSLSDKQYHYYLQDHQGNNRVVISQNGTVEETNHYYPFGGVFASTNDVQPYKYNGKELDTKKGLNWYDYGARQYDAAIGRFTTNDRFAEKYHSMSIYQYGANNPMNNIDLNGDSIIIQPNANGIVDKIKLSFGFETKYQTTVKADLLQLKRDNRDVEKMILNLESSENVHYITMPRKRGVNATGYDREKVSRNIPQGSKIYYDPYSQRRNGDNNKIRTPRVGLSHELQHAFDVDKGMATHAKTKNGIKLMDIRAINTENKVRKAIGESKRVMYGTKKVPEELLE